MEEPELVEHGVTFMLILNCFVFASVCHPFLALVDAWPSESMAPKVIEVTVDALFSIEITVRFIACPARRRFFCQIYNLFDIFAGILPLGLRIADLVLWQDNPNETVQNYFLCVVPVLRFLKLLRRFETFRLLFKAFMIAFEALPVMMYTLAVIILIFSSVFYLVEPRDNVPSLGIAMYATIMTLTTVGYGDISPVSSVGQAVMCFLSIVSTLYLSIPVGIIGTAFSNVWEDRDRVLLAQRTRIRLQEMNLSASDVPSLFLYFDHDHDGVLSLKEFRSMISTMNIDLGKQRVNELFCLLDQDRSGSVSDEEFVRAVFPALHASIYGTQQADPTVAKEAELSGSGDDTSPKSAQCW